MIGRADFHVARLVAMQWLANGFYCYGSGQCWPVCCPLRSGQTEWVQASTALSGSGQCLTLTNRITNRVLATQYPVKVSCGRRDTPCFLTSCTDTTFSLATLSLSLSLSVRLPTLEIHCILGAHLLNAHWLSGGVFVHTLVEWLCSVDYSA